MCQAMPPSALAIENSKSATVRAAVSRAVVVLLSTNTVHELGLHARRIMEAQLSSIAAFEHAAQVLLMFDAEAMWKTTRGSPSCRFARLWALNSTSAARCTEFRISLKFLSDWLGWQRSILLLHLPSSIDSVNPVLQFSMRDAIPSKWRTETYARTDS